MSGTATESGKQQPQEQQNQQPPHRRGNHRAPRHGNSNPAPVAGSGGGVFYPNFYQPPSNNFYPPPNNFNQQPNNQSNNRINRRPRAAPPDQRSDYRQRGNRSYRNDDGEHSYRKVKERTDHNGKPMESEREECLVCCQNSDVFGIGDCRHPACMECVIRMRCVGKQTTCHACRANLPLMSFVRKPPDWDNFQFPKCDSRHPDSAKHNICFQDRYVAECYDSYNQFSCKICSRRGEFAEFPSFPALKQHMGTHGLSFCHICVENLNILPKDCETFNTEELKQHMAGERKRNGFKGHPQCEFCHLRFFDEEAQYKHLRKDHFYCAVCEGEAITNVFFNRIEQLRRHYQKEHFPCSVPDCLEMGIVFRNEFDLNVHSAQVHGTGGHRNVPIDIQFSRTGRYGSPPRSNHHAPSNSMVAQAPLARPQGVIIPSAQFSGSGQVQIVPPPSVRQGDFPSLSVANPVQSSPSNWRTDLQSARSRVQPAPKPTVGSQLNSTSHFPTLTGAPGTSNSTNSSAWGKKNVAEMLKKPTPTAKTKLLPTQSRRHIIPLPEVWPENMRVKLEARELGLPEPPDLYPPLPQPEFKKKKEPKKKTVKASAVQHKIESAPISSSNSKFKAFMSVEDGENEDVASDAWLSSTAMKAKQKKLNQKKKDKELDEERKAQEKEREEKNKLLKLTYDEFLVEKEEKERLAKEKEEIQAKLNKWDADHDHVADAKNSIENKSYPTRPEDTDDPMLRLLMEQFQKITEKSLTVEERLRSLAATTNKTSSEEIPPSTIELRPCSSGFDPYIAPPPGMNPIIHPPPGFETKSLQKPPGL